MKKYLPIFAAILAGCSIGPNYKRPAAPVPPAYKEQPPESFKEWKQAHPSEGAIRGKWWEIYNDSALNTLEDQVNISNQNVLSAAAQYNQARAAIRVSRAALFPAVTGAPSVSAARGSGNLGSGQVSSVSTVAGGGIRTDYFLPFDLSWTADIWGSIRRGVTASIATAQASAADLANARLSYQTLLAEDYFSMHGLDAQQKLLAATVEAYRQFLELTEYQYQSGIVSAADVAAARTQVDSARASLINTGVARAQYEHAIAVLTGRPPSEYTAPETALTSTPPPVPVALPSELLERRPDIAAAERAMAASNEQIGIAKAAYFPTITLSASAGFESSSILKLLDWPSRFWSLGPQAAETLFDAGSRRGRVLEAQAAYDAAVANYRQTVLTAFQGVEDNLSALRILAQEAEVQQQTIRDAQETVRVTTDQYQSGTATYLQVLSAQAALYSAQSSAVSTQTQRMTASVLLIQALGGGWNESELPSGAALSK